jgi:hypothetical protein
MIDPTLLLFLIAVLVVLVTSLIKLPWFTERTKVTVATVTSVIGAAVHVWLTGDFEALELVPTALQVLGGSQLLYHFIMKGTSLDKALESVGVDENYDPDA